MSKMKKSVACLLAAALSYGMIVFAQQPRPVRTAAGTDIIAPGVELFAGYSYWAPHGSINGFSFKDDAPGMLFSGAYFFNRYAGWQIEGERHPQTANDGMQAFSMGPIFRYSTGQRSTPFLHALAGGAEVTGPNVPSTGNGSGYFYNPEHWGVALTVGGGMDYATPLFHHHLSLRLFQADFQYIHVSFGSLQPTTGGRANIHAARLSTGIVYSFCLPRARKQ